MAQEIATRSKSLPEAAETPAFRNAPHNIEAEQALLGELLLHGGIGERLAFPLVVKQEGTKNYEIGAKTTWLDNRLQINADIFSSDYKNIQLDFSGLYEDIVNGVRVATTRTTTDVVNAPGTGSMKRAPQPDRCDS